MQNPAIAEGVLSLDKANRRRELHNLRKLGWTINIGEYNVGYVATISNGTRGGSSIPQETLEDAEKAAIMLIMHL